MLLQKLNRPNVRQIAEAAILNMVKRAITGNSSDGLNKMFKVIHPRLPRGKKSIKVHHRGKVNRQKSNFSAYAADRFNNLPEKFRNPDITCKSFKRLIKVHTKTYCLLKQHLDQKTLSNQKSIQ